MSGRLFRVRLREANDEGAQQLLHLDGLTNEQLKKVPRLQHFGLSSNAPVGAHGLGVQFGGGPDGGRLLNMALGLEHADHRPRNGEVGSTALYDANENLISLVQKELRVTGKRATVVEGKDQTTVRLKDGTEVILKDGKVYLGGMQGAQAVMTAGGPSSRVFAVV